MKPPITEYARTRRAIIRAGATRQQADEYERQILKAAQAQAGIGGNASEWIINRLAELDQR